MTDPIENEPLSEWLGAYLDGELNPECRAWVESHLASCSICQQELEELRRISRLLHADPQPASKLSSDLFISRLLEHLSGQNEREPFSTHPSTTRQNRST
jgi:anti-sigma factor RsiW